MASGAPVRGYRFCCSDFADSVAKAAAAMGSAQLTEGPADYEVHQHMISLILLRLNVHYDRVPRKDLVGRVLVVGRDACVCPSRHSSRR